MNRLVQYAVAFAVCFSPMASPGGNSWLTDYEAAKAQAASSRRPILINFTGSDWCPACIRLRKEVFDQPEFTSYANSNLILLELDFPRTRPQNPSVQQANQKLAKQFGVTHFPSLFLADSQGQPKKRISGGGTAPQFVHLLQQSTAQMALRPPERPAGTAGSSAPRRELPLFGGAATKPPPTYTNLVLKSITGGRTRRFALINSETLAAGESATVTVGAEKVTLQCVEIREQSVLVKVTGDSAPRELRLADVR